MGTLIAFVVVPPVGELEVSGDGGSPTQEQMDEELAAREETVAQLRPYLESLPERPARRSGNVSHVQLLGNNTWSNLNRYMVILEVDIGDPRIEEGLLQVLPEGTSVDVHHDYAALDAWPAEVTERVSRSTSDP